MLPRSSTSIAVGRIQLAAADASGSGAGMPATVVSWSSARIGGPSGQSVAKNPGGTIRPATGGEHQHGSGGQRRRPAPAMWGPRPSDQHEGERNKRVQSSR